MFRVGNFQEFCDSSTSLFLFYTAKILYKYASCIYWSNSIVIFWKSICGSLEFQIPGIELRIYQACFGSTKKWNEEINNLQFLNFYSAVSQKRLYETKICQSSQNGRHTAFWEGDSATLIGTRDGSDNTEGCGEVYPVDFGSFGENSDTRSCFITGTGINKDDWFTEVEFACAAFWGFGISTLIWLWAKFPLGTILSVFSKFVSCLTLLVRWCCTRDVIPIGPWVVAR